MNKSFLNIGQRKNKGFQKEYWLRTLIAPLCAMVAGHSAYGDDSDVFSFDAQVQKMTDSNLARSADPVSDSITSLVGTIAANKSFETQRIHLRWSQQNIHYDDRKDLDANLQVGELNLHSDWTHRLMTNLSWSRNSYQIDLLEFPEKDVVTQDIANIKIGYGSENRLATYIGAQEVDQTHFNAQRAFLNYQEKEGFFETDYRTANQSLVAFYVKSGSRNYTDFNAAINPNGSPLDFDYRQIELDGQWVLASKTKFAAVVASFKRDGDINKGAGTLCGINATWMPSEKISIKLGYQLNRPAIGELADTPETEKTIRSSIEWQFSQKIKLSAEANEVNRNYTLMSSSLARQEKFYLYSPIKLEYSFTNSVSLRAQATVRRNESPVFYRDYDSHQASLSLLLHF